MNKDLGVKIGTPTEAKWTEILTVQKESMLSSKINQEIAELLIIHAEKRIAEEEAKKK